jgi:hypothetical protein
MITALVLVAFTGVSLMVPVPDALTPDSVPMIVEVQLNVADPIVEVGKKLSGVALQMSCIKDVGVLVMTGLGVTLTSTEIGLPGQPFALGVMI